MGLMLGLIMGLLGGPALAFAVRAPGSLAAFEKRRQAFAKGEGKNPVTDLIGPHKSFGHNALVFGGIFGVVGLFVGSMV